MPLIRNASGHASEDAIRSLVISHKLLGTREWFIIHHTDCGMELFTNETMPELLEKSLEAARLEEVKEATPGRRGIGLVEIPFVEPEAEVCQADLLGVLVYW